MFTKILKSMVGKAVMAAVVLGGALSFAGAPNAQAAERIVRREVVVHRDFYGPRFDYRHVDRRAVYAHGWCDRFGRWHRY
jgi:hypothetical protein